MPQELFTTPLFLDPSLVAYYRLENINDSKASFTLTNNNTVAFNPALFNKGADQGASNTNKYLGIANNLGISGNCSINMWVNVTTDPGVGGQCRLVTIQNATTHVRMQVNYEDTAGVKTITFSRVRQGTSNDTVSKTQSLGTSAWHMITLTFDGATLKGYYDAGTPVTVASSGSGASGLADLFYIGQNESASIPLSGITDEVAVFSRPLSVNEITGLFNGFSGMLGKFR